MKKSKLARKLQEAKRRKRRVLKENYSPNVDEDKKEGTPDLDALLTESSENGAKYIVVSIWDDSEGVSDFDVAGPHDRDYNIKPVSREEAFDFMIGLNKKGVLKNAPNNEKFEVWPISNYNTRVRSQEDFEEDWLIPLTESKKARGRFPKKKRAIRGKRKLTEGSLPKKDSLAVVWMWKDSNGTMNHDMYHALNDNAAAQEVKDIKSNRCYDKTKDIIKIMPLAKYENKFNMITSPYLNTEYLGFFMGSNSSEIQSKKIRQAVNYGFNRDKMITYLRNGIGIPAKHGFIPKGLPGFNELDGFTYQPIKARDLVSQYIKESGNKNPSISIGTNSQYLDLCEYIQRELEKIGIKVIIDVVPPSTLRQLKSSGELDIFRASWIADYPDAENYLSLFYSENFTPNGPNYTHFKNSTYDSLYISSLSVSNIDDRKLLYEKMDSIIINEAPVVPLYYDMAVRFVNKKVTGLGINPQNFLVLKRVKKSN